MTRRPVFYSFHYDNDVNRVQQIRNIGVFEDNKPANPNEWEQIKRTGEKSIQNWIDNNMKYKQCVVVLIGEETANRKWVRYEIKKAIEDGRAIIGIYIHNIRCMNNSTSKKGKNPFDMFSYKGKPLSNFIECHDPSSSNAYNEIRNNMSTWIEIAIQEKKQFA